LNVWVISDLHLTGDITQSISGSPIPLADICVIAGDLSDNVEASMKWLGRNIRPSMPVIYVLGNHDFLGLSLTEAPEIALRFALANGILLLDNSTVIIDDVRFIGTTLWTDFEIDADCKMTTEREILMAWGKGTLPSSRAMKLSGKTLDDLTKGLSALGLPVAPVRPVLSEKEHLRIARTRAFVRLNRCMPEYTQVHVHAASKQLPRLMGPADAYELHLSSRRYVELELARSFDGRTVVVSHHVPHPKSISPQFESHPLNPAFVSDLSQIIENRKPNIWIHGHTHCSCDYFVGQTRIICNPHGGAHPNPQFEWQKVVAI